MRLWPAVLRVRYHEGAVIFLTVADGAGDQGRIHRKGSGPIRRNTMAKGNNAQKKETKKPKKDSAKNGKKK